MALLAGLWERGLNVIRVGRSLEILQMAADTCPVRTAQVVIAIYVALRALHRAMRSAEREAGGRVIEGRAGPVGSGVALLTAGRESGLHMVRIGRRVEVLDVAGRAIGRRSDKLAVNVALRAGHIGVRAGQREFRKGGVIESRRIPSARVVAGLARGREAGLRVRRVVRLVEVRHMAAHAACRRQCELAACVAGVAIEGSVRAHQGKACELHVVELRAHPVVDGVAGFASRRHSQCNVINARGLGVNEVSLVARVAGGRKTLELS